MSLTGSSTGSALVADGGGDTCAALPSPLPLSLNSVTAVAATTPGTSIAQPYTVSTPSSLLPSPSSPGNNGGTNHPLHPQQLQLHQLQQQRRSYNRSLSSSPPGQAEAEGGGGPIPVIEFPDDEVYFYPRVLLLLLPESSVGFDYKYPPVLVPWPLPSSIRDISAVKSLTVLVE